MLVIAFGEIFYTYTEPDKFIVVENRKKISINNVDIRAVFKILYTKHAINSNNNKNWFKARKYKIYVHLRVK